METKKLVGIIIAFVLVVAVSVAFVIVKMYPPEEEIYLPTNIRELSLSELWNATLTKTGVENSTANLS